MIQKATNRYEHLKKEGESNDKHLLWFIFVAVAIKSQTLKLVCRAIVIIPGHLLPRSDIPSHLHDEWCMRSLEGHMPGSYDKAKGKVDFLFPFFLFLFLARSHRGSMHKRSWRSWIDHLWECTWVCMQAASSHKSVAPACACSLASAESAHLPSCEPVCVFCGCGSREGRWRRERERGVGGGGCWCANVHHVEGLWMGGCDVKRDPNAGAYLEAVKGTVCHIPGDYLSKTQHQLSFQETGRKSNFLDHSNRLVLKFFLFNSLSARSAFIISDSPYRICEWQAFFFLAPAFRCCHVQSTRTYSHLDFYRLLHLRSVDLRN